MTESVGGVHIERQRCAGRIDVNSFDTSAFGLGYPPAIRNTIWLGDCDDNGAVEYNLNGTPTGNTSSGGGNFSQLLDGAAGNGVNYGVECCGGPNSVAVADADWSNQQVLFDLPSTGLGIAFDPTDDTLYIAAFGSTVSHFDLSGSLLGSFSIANASDLAGPAYEALTSFWVYDQSTSAIVQFDRDGDVLSSAVVGGLQGQNIFGGEMVFTGSDFERPIPAPAMGLFILGLGAVVGAGLRRRAR